MEDFKGMLKNFPPAPPDRHGWPWIAEPSAVQEAMPGGAPWPKISIVTPSLNQGAYIEETIRSVLLQGYPNLEYIVIDGGSTDGSIEVIERYSPWIAHRVSEPDKGQGHAINKGMAAGSGDILAYLNSDDILVPGALHAAAACFLERPEIDLVHGACLVIDELGQKIGKHCGAIETLEDTLNLWEVWWAGRNLVQPEVFWTRRIADQIGPFREDLHFALDYDYWVRILVAGGKLNRIDNPLAAFRITPHQKSRQSERVAEELLAVVRPFLWNYGTPIALLPRIWMQSMWLYNRNFLTEIHISLNLREHKLLRWRRLASSLMRHPKILISPGFRHRFGEVIINKGSRKL